MLPHWLQPFAGIKRREIIDDMVTWDPKQCRLSPGTLIEALVINILTGTIIFPLLIDLIKPFLDLAQGAAQAKQFADAISTLKPEQQAEKE